MELLKAINLFLGEHKPTTKRSYTRPLVMMSGWIGGGRMLSEIKPELMLEYFQLKVKAMKYAPATTQKHVKTVKTFFNWCVKMEMIEKSPARMVRGVKLRGAIDRSKAMTDGELMRLLDISQHKPRDYALFMFLADSGCRRGGAVGLRIQDVNWEKLIAVVTEKGDKERKVAFGEKCAKAMLHWLAYRSAHYRLKPATADDPHIYVFSFDGRLMKAENISLAMRRAAKAAGLSRPLSPHSLRHRKGHQFADAHVAPSIAATALGHHDSTITLTYYYPNDWDSAEKELRKLVTNPETLPETAPNVIKFGGG